MKQLSFSKGDLSLAEMYICLIMTNKATHGQVHTDFTPGQIAPSANVFALSSLCLLKAGRTRLQSTLTAKAPALKDNSQHDHRVEARR